MRYNININQSALIELGSNLSLEEAVLLDYLFWLCTSPSEQVEAMRIQKDGIKYTWFDYGTYIKETPILRGKTEGTIVPKVKALVDEGFIQVELIKGKRGQKMKYVQLLPKIDSLFRKLNGPIEKTKWAYLDNSMYNNNKDNTNKDKTIVSTLFGKAEIEEIFSAYKSKIQNKCRLTPPAITAIKKALGAFRKEELLKGVDNFSKDSWWMKTNGNKGPVWYFNDLKHLDRFIGLVPEKKSGVTII